MNATTLWSQWENCHDEPEQQKRLESARDSTCTPASVDKKSYIATFKSKRGNYTTSLSDCNCTDYKRRGLPCKHMYRLALETGLLSGPYSSYLHGGYTWIQAIDIIEQFPENVQKEFLFQFSNSCKKTDFYRTQKAPEIDTLISAGVLIECPEKETAKYKTVRVIDDFMVDKRKTEWYFSRKLFPPRYFDGEKMAPDYDSLPNDDITALLRERGFVK